MERRNNLATVSLVAAVLLLVSWIGGMCVSFVPFVGMIAIFLIPLEWIFAFVSLVTGIAGYRASALSGGAGSAIAGIAISGCWLLFQIVMIGFVFLIFGAAGVLTILGAVAGSQ